MLQRGGGPDLAFRAYLLTAVRRLHVDQIRATPRLHTTDDLTPFDPGVPFRDTAVEGFESARGRQGVRLAARALADGAVAHRGRGPEARRHRAAARDERQLGLRAGLPRPRGPAPGVPHHARAGAGRATPAAGPTRNLGAYVRSAASPAATPPRSRTTSTSCRPARRSTSSSPRSTPTCAGLARRRCCSAVPRRRTSRGGPGRRRRRHGRRRSASSCGPGPGRRWPSTRGAPARSSPDWSLGGRGARRRRQRRRHPTRAPIAASRPSADAGQAAAAAGHGPTSPPAADAEPTAPSRRPRRSRRPRPGDRTSRPRAPMRPGRDRPSRRPGADAGPGRPTTARRRPADPTPTDPTQRRTRPHEPDQTRRPSRPTPTAVDLGVTRQPEPGAGRLRRSCVRVTGLSADAAAVTRHDHRRRSWPRPSTTTRRCDLLGIGTATCRISGDGHDLQFARRRACRDARPR